MEITHNHINDSIDRLSFIARKGIPGAKKNKNRQIRAEVQKMKEKQNQCIVFNDVWFYFKKLISRYLKNIENALTF